MDRIELEDNGFPWTAKAVRFMQDSYKQAIENLCKSLGGDFIAWGCEVAGSAITDGAIVISGEIIPFKGGSYSDKFTVRETAQNATYEDNTQRAAFFNRVAECSLNGEYSLSNMPRLKRQQKHKAVEWIELSIDLSANLVPGDEEIHPYEAFDFAPKGVLKANKDESGNVMLVGGYNAKSETGDYRYALLPENLRPKSRRYVQVRYLDVYVGDNKIMAGFARIEPDGEIVIPGVFTNEFRPIFPIFNCSFNID